MMTKLLPKQVVVSIAMTLGFGIAGGAIIVVLGSWGVPGIISLYLISISTMEMMRCLYMVRSFQEAMSSVALARKFRDETADLDEFEHDDLKKKICKARSTCGACRKCWARPRAVIIISGLALGIITLLVALMDVQAVANIEIAITLIIAGIVVATMEFVVVNYPRLKTGAFPVSSRESPGFTRPS